MILKRTILRGALYIALWIAKKCEYGAVVIVVNGHDPEELGVITSFTKKYYDLALKFAMARGPAK